MKKRISSFPGKLIMTILIFYFISEKGITAQAATADHDVSTQSTSFNTLVWSDEFDGEGTIDTMKWFHQTQLPPGGSWWGGLIQHYTNRDGNTYLQDGYLHLMAKKEELEDQGEVKQYTSARLNSKYAFTYGRVEVRAQMPEGVGTWPAIWLLNKNINEAGAYWERQGYGEVNWPNCGEIDILEHWGKNQDFVSSAVHNGSSYGYNVKNVGGQKIEGASSEFHIYTFEWTEAEMIFSVDGVEHFRYNPSIKDRDTWPFDSDYYLILNVAIERDIDPGFTESPMVVDYIRIYQ